MAINFAQSSDVFTSKIPRTVSVFDPTGGCPTTRSNPILSLTFTTTSAKSAVIIQGEIIRARYTGGQPTCNTRIPWTIKIHLTTWLTSSIS